MDIQNLHLIYFSPTGTTKKVVTTIARSFGSHISNVTDITLPNGLGRGNNYSENDLTVIGVPVYGGRVPELALERLKVIKGGGGNVVIVVVYGGRDYDDALLELKNFVENSGFAVIAAGAFIGEHSFSTDLMAIASGRPNKHDLIICQKFGEEIVQKLNTIGKAEACKNVHVSGGNPYKELKERKGIAPVTDESMCTQCGECVKGCPVQAIEINDSTVTNIETCIWCCACVKKCNQEARSFDDYVLQESRKKLVELYSENTEPTLFL
jgi:NAD-dependent dihydropyrimidine dehydrogenase PreA subunit/flavodoxin